MRGGLSLLRGPALRRLCHISDPTPPKDQSNADEKDGASEHHRQDARRGGAECGCNSRVPLNLRPDIRLLNTRHRTRNVPLVPRWGSTPGSRCEMLPSSRDESKRPRTARTTQQHSDLLILKSLGRGQTLWLRDCAVHPRIVWTGARTRRELVVHRASAAAVEWLG